MNNNTLQNIIEAFQKKYNLDSDVEKITSLQLKIIEDEILRKAKVPISESTLRRIFQQKTENPQLATLNALCVCLGYSGYTDFLSSTNQPNEENKEEDSDSLRTNANILQNNNIDKNSKSIPFFKRKSFYLISIVLFLIILSIILRPFFERYQFSRIVFESDFYSGTPPTTFHIKYHIPWGLDNDAFTVEYIDADGKIVGPNKIDVNLGYINKSFFQLKENFAVLKYKDKTIRRLKFFIRNNGWTIWNSKNGFISNTEELRKNGTFQLAYDSALYKYVYEENSFIEYEYYDEKGLGDGDNFTMIARLRNSIKDRGIPYYDINVDVVCEEGDHSIIFNSGAVSYIAIHNSEKYISGETHDFSHLSYILDEWQLVKIKVTNKFAEFFINDELFYSTQYNNTIGSIASLMLRFKGFGTIDYVRLYDDKGSLVFEDDFY